VLEASSKTSSYELHLQDKIWRFKVKGKENIYALANQGASIAQGNML
jgi:hypothetical protein